MMIFVNEATKWKQRPRSILSTFVTLLYPFAPHISEELWQRLGNASSLANESWPLFNEDFIKEDSKEIVIQINGKLRASMQVPLELCADKAELERRAMEVESIKKRIEGKTIRKIIAVPNKLVNIVVS